MLTPMVMLIPTYSIVGGEDRGLFEISDDGKLVFIDAPAFSVSSDNNYVVEIQAQDPHGATDVVQVSVSFGGKDR